MNRSRRSFEPDSCRSGDNTLLTAVERFSLDEQEAPLQLWRESNTLESKLCLAHYIIGMKALLQREMQTANEQLRLASKYPVVGHWGFHSARSFVKKLDVGWAPTMPR